KNVRVFPVNTRLSRHLTQNADCVVEIQQAIGKDGLSESMYTSIHQCVAQLKVKSAGAIQFRIAYTPEGRAVVEKLHATGEFKELAAAMGYSRSTVAETLRLPDQ
ncbi:MAG: hypothetical protein KDA85_13830, partial [Planctomycetaceae bacterium]|nr:hypothetical protein [Planctomycetaceae bacterium]